MMIKPKKCPKHNEHMIRHVVRRVISLRVESNNSEYIKKVYDDEYSFINRTDDYIYICPIHGCSYADNRDGEKYD